VVEQTSKGMQQVTAFAIVVTVFALQW